MTDPLKALEDLVTKNRFAHVAIDCDTDETGQVEFAAVLYEEPEESRQQDGYGKTLAEAILNLYRAVEGSDG